MSLVASQDCSIESLLFYAPASSTSTPIARSSATNRYVVIVFKDTGNDDGATQSLQGALFVECVKQ